MAKRSLNSIPGVRKKRIDATSRLCIIVLGYLVRGPMGGLAWHHLQYVMGLDRLGHDVYFVEDSEDYPSCYNPVTGITDIDPTYGLEFVKNIFEKVGLDTRWAYYDAHTRRWSGPCGDQIPSICSNTDLLLNISGINPLRPWFLKVPVRLLIDTDPVFTQIKHLKHPENKERALQHTAFFSFGENIRLSSCSIPNDGLPWRPTRQPIVLDAWPITPGPQEGKFTTVMQWKSYRGGTYNGQRFGMKSDSFESFLALPHTTGPIFELATHVPPSIQTLMVENHWATLDPKELSRDPWTYQEYIKQSKGEFSLAKHGYVVTRSGWFSERSAGYLASGRPVLGHDTGFSDWLKTDSGVIPFNTPEEALAGIDEINRNYTYHCRTARVIAEEYFDARRVLTDLLEQSFAHSEVVSQVSPKSITHNG